MRVNKIHFFLLISIFFISCGDNTPKVNNSYVLIFKSEEIKFSDTAFIEFNEKKADIQGYFSGKAVLDLTFNRVVCLQGICMDKSEFNARYLHYSYYDNLFLDVINKKPLDITKEIQKNQNGFTQKFQDDKRDIVYRVTKDESFFRDKKNKILIKIKKL